MLSVHELDEAGAVEPAAGRVAAVVVWSSEQVPGVAHRSDSKWVADETRGADAMDLEEVRAEQVYLEPGCLRSACEGRARPEDQRVSQRENENDQPEM